MDETVVGRVAAILHEAAETHHQVFRITEGADEDWATWYADWLVNLSELPAALGSTPVRSELTWALVQCGRDFASRGGEGAWEPFYARELLERFGG